jgi:PPOX class probable F420-dependent enzyme
VLNDEDLAMLRGRNVGHLVTLNPDGTPQSTPIWLDADDEGNILANTAAGRTKDRNMRQDARVALSVTPQDNAYRWLSVNGTVVGMLEGAEADAHIDALSRRYTGKPWGSVEGQVRVMFTIRPDRVVRSS